ncbi:FYVE and coiled-coil domain-containing protein 1-like isoform X3 [Scleropages formosus]|uniref:FYVE and coiled-coil domain autophagy adaptor 1 n=1 Tax=Scleropages formosus TaxID=113540 RepID=A0A8C9R9V3_SCLFO|nr:FYVE and coiled-coil domain-containing protein 1-like isoform X3 [Scleropages formosus]
MAATSVGESQLHRIIRDLHEAVAELSREYKDIGDPITDDSPSLHKFSYKLEYLLQFDQKEKKTLLGTRKDYWDYFCDCLAKIKGANDGIRYVKSIPVLKTSLGKGRAFIRYSLVHQRLADTLQQCLMNERVTSEWYYARSPFLKSHLNVDIISHLYELNEVQFDVASMGYDLDSAWPTFARRSLGSPAHLWKPPSRYSSVSSLVSSYSQQAPDFLCSPDQGPSLLSNIGETASCWVVDDLRMELDQSELKRQELLEQVRQLQEESAGLRALVRDLEGQLQGHLKQSLCRSHQETLENQRALELTNQETAERLLTTARELEALRAEATAGRELEAKLSSAECRNMELLAQLDGALGEKGRQAASHFDSAQKIHTLLDKLNEAEKEKLEALREADGRKREAERLAEELRMKESSMFTREENSAMLKQVKDLQSTIKKLQGALTVKEKESSNLQMQLQDLQNSQEVRERQVEELKRRIQAEKEDLQQRHSSLKEQMEGQIHNMTEQLKAKEDGLSTSVKKIQGLEKQVEKLVSEKEGLWNNLVELEGNVKDQARRIEEYKMQCNSLMELNSKLLQTVKRNEEIKKEVAEVKGVLENELTTLRASERQLRGQGGDAVFAVDEGERQLREENILLDESLQRAMLLKEVSKGAVRRLEQENCELRVEEGMEKGALSLMQEELCSVSAQIAELEKNLATSKSNEETLQEKLQENSLLQLNMRLGEDLCVQVDELEGRWVKNSQEGSSRLALAEGQLDLSVKEVSRLRDEVVDLRCKLQDLTEEKLKVQAQLEVTEASRQELKALVKQFKGQVEELNRRHVQELLQHKQKEVALERETEAQALESTSSKEELASLKRSHELLALESAETKDCLQRVNMEMAELSIHICSLNSEKDDTQRRLGSASTRLREMEEEVACGVEQLLVLQRENANLREELCKLESLQGKLEQAETQSRSLQESAEEEINAIRFQMSCETLNHQSQLKSLNEELEGTKHQLKAKLEKVSSLEAKVSQLEAENSRYCELLEKKKVHIKECEGVIRRKDSELKQQNEKLRRAEEKLATAQKACHDLSEQLNRAVAERKSCDMKTSAEIDDLYRTKKNLEERLIELIRDKDTLWQKWDALEFQQKQRCEEVTEKDASHCLACQGQFSWWQRRHPCRLCGRTFCYYCSNCSSKVTPGGKRERCCRNCSASPDHQIETELGSPPSTPNSHSASYGHRPHVSVSEQVAKPDDGTYDVITEEEINGVCNYDLQSHTTEESPERVQKSPQRDTLDLSTRTGDTTTEDADDLSLVVQDAEIYLLKSGEITLTVPFSLDEVSLFGEAPRELFIKSSCYSIIPITVPEAGHTISWLFSSEPKSISFGVVHREANNGPLEQSKVLIPLTRCNSHKETIQGQLKVRNPGTYTLIFDNSFSRFISKKVQYHLTVKKPIICDRSESS